MTSEQKSTLPLPESCAHCGTEQREHVQQWHPEAGWHGYVAPSTQLITERMWARLSAE